METIFNATSLRLSLLVFFLCCGGLTPSRAAGPVVQRQLLFTFQGKTGMINSDGKGLKYFEFDVPNQATWQPGPLFPDGKRIVSLSMEPRRDGPAVRGILHADSDAYLGTRSREWLT
jgi:hypothetical protein